MFLRPLVFGLALAITAPAVWADEAAKPYLGVFGEDVQTDANTTGSVVRHVAPGSPAEKAGLKAGDIVLAIGDKPVATFIDLANDVRSRKPGDKVEVTISREGKEQKLELTIGERPTELADGSGPFGANPSGPGGGRFRIQIPGFNGPVPGAVQQYFDAAGTKRPMIGIQLQPLSDALKEKLGHKDVAGVLVTDVVPDSPAAKAGVESEDVITEIDGVAVDNPKVLIDAVMAKKAGEEVTLKVLRDGQTVEKKVAIEEMAAPPIALPRRFPFGQFANPGGEDNAEYVENLLVPGARVMQMQTRIDELEKKVTELQAEIEKLKSEKK